MAKKHDVIDIKYTRDVTKFQTDPPEFKDGNAGIDLRSAVDWLLMPDEIRKLPTSFKMKIPSGFFGMCCSRSGLAAKNGVYILNSPGIIDENFVDTWEIVLHNASRIPFQIHKNDRIAQVVFVPYVIPNFQALGGEEFAAIETNRAGGFGSSGIK